MAEGFLIDPRLLGESVPLGFLPLSAVLLRDDARFAWVILVPRRPGLVELTDLTPAERAGLMEEIAEVSAALAGLVPGCKINVGALGNIVRQLHVHVVAREAGDAAWPGPVWGAGERVPLAPDLLAARVASLQRALFGAVAGATA
ncbi:MAG: HIT domain-containing protein [Alphaproteobacteria bacterium]|nr:HIT domain-containing protein [Alphaproteobacteria bacterium]